MRGERGPASVGAERSFQSRMSSVMACGTMLLLGIVVLTWYYSRAVSNARRARQSAQATLVNHAQGELPLPAFGKLESARPAAASEPAASRELPDVAVQGAEVPAMKLMTQPRESLIPQSVTLTSPEGGLPGPKAKTPLERRLSGAAFALGGEGQSTAQGTTGPAPSTADGSPSRGLASDPETHAAAAPRSDMAALLRGDMPAAVRAQLEPTQTFLLPKGTFIDCTLETAIDSTLPGMTTCIAATDTFGMDGKVVLLERGTKLIGETRGQVQQGGARLFVLWTQARTPAGVIIDLDSPATDELGRSGVTGEVSRHFWDRFGAAILVSTLDGAIQAGVQSTARGGGAIIYNPAGSESIITDLLKGTVNIPPTVMKRNGERIQVLVARDLDFRSVYRLRTNAAAR